LRAKGDKCVGRLRWVQGADDGWRVWFWGVEDVLQPMLGEGGGAVAMLIGYKVAVSMYCFLNLAYDFCSTGRNLLS
jgi:hypothetical protein